MNGSNAFSYGERPLHAEMLLLNRTCRRILYTLADEELAR